ncbi:MAG: ferritin family protein [Candidatus Diapherotrites archaeon]
MDRRDRGCVFNALPLEIQAVQNYRRLAEQVKDLEMKKYLELFEANEQSHIEALKEIISKYANSEGMRELDEKMKEPMNNPVDFSAELREIITKLLELEELQVKKYSNCTAVAQNIEIREIFYHFIENEKLHAELLKKMILSLTIKEPPKDNKCEICGTQLASHLHICHGCAKKEMEKSTRHK